jgi:hypothetical protein
MSVKNTVCDDTLGVKIERHTWLNTILGMLDNSFSLQEEELYQVTTAVRSMLEALGIPERGEPEVVSSALLLEAEGSTWSQVLHGPRNAGVPSYPRAVNGRDTTVTLEAWRQALLSMITSAYPSLDNDEILLAASTFDDILLSLGVPERVAYYIPNEVVRAHLSGA